MNWYRIVYSDGSYSAWSCDFEFIRKKAERYNASIEVTFEEIDLSEDNDEK